MIIEGKVIVYGRDNINTDEIIPARYLNTSDPDQLAAHCMEDLDAGFLEKKKSSNLEIMVTGANMGCGSSREHAPISLKGAGIKAVVAPSFARIFFRNSMNMGLAIFECKDPAFFGEVETGDALRIMAKDGKLENITKKKTYSIQKLPDFLQELIAAGGLVPFGKKLLEDAAT
ncbi:MAG: 3-isopropylmalate dehydratase small subunit [Promethearchaeota archaeon]